MAGPSPSPIAFLRPVLAALVLVVAAPLTGASQTFDPLAPGPAPAPSLTAPSTTAPSTPASSAGQPPPIGVRTAPNPAGSDPYARQTEPATRIQRDHRRETQLIEIIDGTPRYELIPDWPISRSDAADSGMLSMNYSDGLPVGAGHDSPFFTGEYADGQFHFEHLIRFWETWPNAKERQGREPPQFGEVETHLHLRRYEQPQYVFPPGVLDELQRQAQAMHDAVLDYPYIQRSADVMVKTLFWPRIQRDPSGVEVYGFQMSILFGDLSSGYRPPRQLANRRWVANFLDAVPIVVCSNCFEELERPTGRHRGFQWMANGILVDTLDKPLWVPEFLTGEGKLIAKPELFDPTRPKTDIQVLTVQVPGGGAPDTDGGAPDTEAARALAAGVLTDWKGLVNRFNSPGSPRAD